MQKFECSIPVEPKAQSRPRFSHHRAYEETSITQWKKDFACRVRFEMKATGIGIFNTAISVSAKCYYATPQSWSKKKQRKAINGEIKKISRPDADNLLKAILDALNGILWTDDALIVSVSVSKSYGIDSKIELQVEEVE